MRTRTLHWTVEAVVRRESRINPQPQYQRTPVWNESKKQLLIDSILRQYDVPKFYLRSADTPYEHEIIDGQQRLRAIWEFFNGSYELGDVSTDVPLFGDLSGLKFSDLSSDVQDKLALFELTLVEVENASDLEIRELFLRLQEGVSLNPTEKRNAMPGNMRDFVAELGNTHAVFPLTKISKKRFAWHELAAIVIFLELSEGPTEVKAPSLRKMYRDNIDFDNNEPRAQRTKRILNYMTQVLQDQPPEMDTKWGFVDLYLLISNMDVQYVIRGHEEDFADFFVAFERERREVISDPSELLSSNQSSPWQKDLYDYIEAFVRTGGTKQNIEKRHNVYKNRFINATQGLLPKDPRRAFTLNERIVIWRRDNQKCQECGTTIDFEQMHADHIIPHSRGGQTALDNGRALCAQCNVSRGDND